MHKGIILLVKVDNTKKIIDTVETFLKYHENSVWDWYSIGSKYSSVLSGYRGEFERLCVKKTGKAIHHQTYKTFENNKEWFRNSWKKIGAIGVNPVEALFSNDNYFNKNYDIMPLEDCLEIVKLYANSETEKEKFLKKAEEHKTKGNIYRYGVYLQFAGQLYAQEFCKHCNVYNIEMENYSIPDDVENYYAVMVDIHY